MRPKATASLILVFLLLTPLIGTTEEASARKEPWEWKLEELDVKLPAPMYRSSLAFTGERAYMFTGRDEEGPKPHIVEFDPEDGTVTLLESQMPTGRIMSAAAYLDPYCYIFGGQDQTGILSDIVRFDPTNGEVLRLDAALPDVRMGCSAVTVGQVIYVIGGRNDTGHVNTVFEFDPENGTVELVASLMATGGGRVCAWNREEILMFGGCGVNCASQNIWAWNPETGEDRVLNTTLPEGVYWTSGANLDGPVLIFGGNDYQVSVDEILLFTPKRDEGTVEVIGHLPKPLELSCAFWYEREGDAYVLGGANGLVASDSIYRVWEEPVEEEEEDAVAPGFGLWTAAAAVAIVALAAMRRRF